MTSPSVYANVHRLSPDKLAVAKAEFNTMEEMGTIRQSVSPWAYSSHMIPKRYVGWRPPGDYRRFNCKYSVAGQVPHIQNFSSQHFGATLLSKIDLVSTWVSSYQCCYSGHQKDGRHQAIRPFRVPANTVRP